ncbi:hypothetical protein JANAI62_18890 [Jannaschia pagri]|uniref:Tetratricopeptide repeat-containing protein n=1 Tax=Jannaschia pagri TaxID=2829797 RepID=A0ABQ4NLP9_9RHOB|nr:MULTISPECIES: hypothetical protein [unclassified Jannaschia]GIT91432.1 hypothetical protein JANAI61_18900 [Jannaschia sp. AI_61]GIT95266.1 hypothetical protein JANAI62_18890 [Jannaschia sp. AI_62]
MTTEISTSADADLAALLEEVREFLAEREGESALMALDDEPDLTTGPEAELLRAEAQIQMAEDFDEALITLERAARAKADPASVATLYKRVRMADVNLKKQASLLSWITERLDDADLAVSLAKLQMRREQPTLAERAANRALDIDPGMPEAHRALYVAILRSETPERAVDAIREALVVARRNPRYPAIMSTLAGMEPSEADALKTEMIDHWPESLGRHLRVGDLDIRNDADFKPEANGVYRLALQGQRDDALAKAEDMIERKQGRGLSAQDEVMAEVLTLLPGPQDRKRPLVEDTNAEVIASEPSQTGVTLLCFTDLTHRLNYDFEVIDAFAARSGAATLFLRDHSFRLFIGGIGSLASDRAGTIAAIKDKLADLKTERLLVMGLSSGGFSAISYARELGAEKVLGLSVATSIGRFLRGDDRRARMLIARLNRSFAPEELDLNAVLPTIDSQCPVDLYYGINNATDRGHSEDIGGLPGVTLHPMEGHARHQVLPDLIRRGTFQAFLDS